MRIIFPDDMAAARRETVTGWVANGYFFGDGDESEEAARRDGATHFECGGCGMPVEAQYKCPCGYDYSYEFDKKKWYGLPIIVWDEKEVVCDIGGENFFRDQDSVLDYCEGNGLEVEGLLLVNTKKLRCYEIDTEFLTDLCVDGDPVELSDEILAKIDEVNYMIGRYDTGYYEPETRNELRRIVLADV